MSTSRRRIIRFPRQPARNGSEQQKRLHKLRERLDEKRKTLSRWLVRLKRAFHMFEKLQGSIARIERQLTQLDES